MFTIYIQPFSLLAFSFKLRGELVLISRTPCERQAASQSLMFTQ